ncbi:MAG TPA: hypothetical protein VNT26_19410 [Candidatus Sulfotelmatobacter sp.]|nr:hypothetical protein [Candidatus Sulfotelmatobacter sp.]
MLHVVRAWVQQFDRRLLQPGTHVSSRLAGGHRVLEDPGMDTEAHETKHDYGQ